MAAMLMNMLLHIQKLGMALIFRMPMVLARNCERVHAKQYWIVLSGFPAGSGLPIRAAEWGTSGIGGTLAKDG